MCFREFLPRPSFFLILKVSSVHVLFSRFRRARTFAVCCSVLQRVAVYCSELQCVAVCVVVDLGEHEPLQCVAVYYIVLQRLHIVDLGEHAHWQHVAVCCSVLQCVVAS